LEEILSAEEMTDSGTNLAEPLKHAIRFENVHFSYGEQVVLNGIDLTIAKGETVALVGPSGSGKTTLVHLLARFYDTTKGQITWDDRPLESFELVSFRSQMGMVTQEARLFNASVTENVTLGAANGAVHELQELEQVANAANALEFIQQMEEGWGSSVGDGGNKLSGGQRQRLSIARALHKDPPVLLLDEATSALDTESEHAVQQAINRLMEGRTTLVVAHRLSTIRHADRIVVLDQGNIVEEGDHEALMARKGMYHRLVSMQDLK
jgi:subfamily B ATP-binding cassette protein MsbA